MIKFENYGMLPPELNNICRHENHALSLKTIAEKLGRNFYLYNFNVQ